MIVVRVGPNDIFHRYLTPKWAYQPHSGAGAAKNGGRFNKPGVEALYLARAPDTALREYQQGSSIAPPATLAAYHITLTKVADLSAGYDPTMWAPIWSEWSCPWRMIRDIVGGIPPSWDLADSLIADGYQGLLYPSVLHPGGTNLVVFTSKMSSGDAVAVYDPHSSLPRDQSSWS